MSSSSYRTFTRLASPSQVLWNCSPSPLTQAQKSTSPSAPRMSLGSSCLAQVAQLSPPGESAGTLEGKLPLWGESAGRRDRYEEPSKRERKPTVLLNFLFSKHLVCFKTVRCLYLNQKITACEYIISNVFLYLMENLIEAQNCLGFFLNWRNCFS